MSLLELTQLATPIWPKQEFKSFYGNLKFFPSPLGQVTKHKVQQIVVVAAAGQQQEQQLVMLHFSIVFISGRCLLPLAD